MKVYVATSWRNQYQTIVVKFLREDDAALEDVVQACKQARFLHG